MLGAVPINRCHWNKDDKILLNDFLRTLNDELIFEVNPVFTLGNIMFVEKLYNVKGKENQFYDIRKIMIEQKIGQIDNRISKKFLKMAEESGIEYYK